MTMNTVGKTAMHSIVPSRSALQKRARRWIIKIGSSLLTQDGQRLDLSAMQNFVQQILQLRAEGIEVVLVSSGSVSAGKCHLGWAQKATTAEERQAAASVGQSALIHAYENLLVAEGTHCGQVLLTRDNFRDRKRLKKTRSAIEMLLKMQVLPIINENDAIADPDNALGNNDHLAALVSNVWHADLMVLLTDQSGLFTVDPRARPDAEMVTEGMAGDPRHERMAGGSGGTVGTGGMLTKIHAATHAARSGAATLIADGRIPGVLMRLRQGELLGTFLRSKKFDRKLRRDAWTGLQIINGQQRIIHPMLRIKNEVVAFYSETLPFTAIPIFNGQ
ncbi:glutamate 5-kinase [Acidithiobacillus ferriphilus]|uniref:glutamate 5-kinase n=1 Tax=Acidithiobacillus TaxID=119977 RepID=UPI00214738B5|nr:MULTISPECIES: glutamate 5-kinase [Acidithiobacillus]MCR1346553.1 glutamate 5-kinase [Acidithiobacillus ferrooxidans]MCR1356608.1 glutamate 5-kinase [Acidithiobacillus ferrooxidans]MDA8152502.1 glutamate 5-kinase [Acidithiobacillus sp.]MEB8536141.1 glutamate 5-kinase [Acidithiobacillus ferriphilus]